MLSLIVAMDNNRLIGCNNQLPWHLPADLAHFKAVTMGKPILMGRKTYDSIGRALPGRRNIVLSRSEDLNIDGVEVVTTPELALQLVGNDNELFVIGGSTVYELMLAHADKIYLTIVDGEFTGDAWFPAIPDSQWQQLDVVERPADEKNKYDCRFITLQRAGE